MMRLLGIAALAAAVAGCSSGSMVSRKGENDQFKDRSQAAKNINLRDEYAGNNLSSVDQPFVRDSLRLTAFEIRASVMAMEKTQHPEVKRIASRLLKDDEVTRQKLLKIMRQRGDIMPTEPTFEQQQTLDKLHELSGADFDVAYLQEMQKSHQYLVTTGRSELEYGKNGDVKVLTYQTVDKWQAELRMLAGEESRMEGARLGSER